MNFDTSNSIDSCRAMVVYQPTPQEKMSVFLRLIPLIKEIQNAHDENFIYRVGLKELASLHIVPTEPVKPGNKNTSLLHVHSTFHQLAMTPEMMGKHTAIAGYDFQGRPYVAIKINLFDAITGEKIVQFVEVIFRRYALAVSEPQEKKTEENLKALIVKLWLLVKDAEIDDKEILENLNRLISLGNDDKLNNESLTELFNISENLYYELDTFKFKLPDNKCKLDEEIEKLKESLSTLSSFDASSLSHDNKLDIKSAEYALKQCKELTSKLNSLIIDSNVRGIPLGEKTKEEILKVLNTIKYKLHVFRRESLTGDLENQAQKRKSRKESYSSALWNRGDDGRAYQSGLYAAGDMSDEQMTKVGQLLRGEKVPYTQVSHLSMVETLRNAPFKYGSNYVMQRANV